MAGKTRIKGMAGMLLIRADTRSSPRLDRGLLKMVGAGQVALLSAQPVASAAASMEVSPGSCTAFLPRRSGLKMTPMPRRTKQPQGKRVTERWSQRVTRESNALDLQPGVFTWDDPHAIARSLQASAQASQRIKTTPFRSAMSMLNFYVNRAGHQLSAEQRGCLEQAKDELRALFGRPRRLGSSPTAGRAKASK